MALYLRNDFDNFTRGRNYINHMNVYKKNETDIYGAIRTIYATECEHDGKSILSEIDW